MSYGSQTLCAPEKVQIYYGVAKGIIPVAAAGNEFEQGNPLEYPANLPHVVSVAATDTQNRSASFSNANDWIDLSAPGVDIMTAVPVALDDDGVQDGYELLSGTSFAAPMVSAAIAWVRQARPDLQPDQVVQAVRLSAHDVGRKGWDPLTGFGVLDVGAALKVPASRLPAHDPARAQRQHLLGQRAARSAPPAAPVWTGGPPTRLDAQLDKEEDPVDVYRIVIPGHGQARVSLDPALRRRPARGLPLQRDLDPRHPGSRRYSHRVGRRRHASTPRCATRAARRTPTTSPSAPRAARSTRTAATRCKVGDSAAEDAGEAAAGDRGGAQRGADGVGLGARLQPARLRQRVEREDVVVGLSPLGGQGGVQPVLPAEFSPWGVPAGSWAPSGTMPRPWATIP